jgi:hypothetical protein
MSGYDGISCMNHLKSMEIDDIVDFLFPNFSVALLHPISTIPCHLHLLCIHILGCVNEGLQIFIHFDAFMGIAWDVLNALR